MTQVDRAQLNHSKAIHQEINEHIVWETAFYVFKSMLIIRIELSPEGELYLENLLFHEFGFQEHSAILVEFVQIGVDY